METSKEIKRKSFNSNGIIKDIITIKTVDHPKLFMFETYGIDNLNIHKHTCPKIEGVNHLQCDQPCKKKTKITFVDNQCIDTRVLIKCNHCPDVKLLVYEHSFDEYDNYKSTAIFNDGSWCEHQFISDDLEPVNYRDSNGVNTKLGSIDLPNPEDIKHLFSK